VNQTDLLADSVQYFFFEKACYYFHVVGVYNPFIFKIPAESEKLKEHNIEDIHLSLPS